MILTRYLQQRGKGLIITIHPPSYLIRNMLVYKQNRNVFPLLREFVKSALDGAVFSLLVDDEEILLAVWRICDVADAREEDACY